MSEVPPRQKLEPLGPVRRGPDALRRERKEVEKRLRELHRGGSSRGLTLDSAEEIPSELQQAAQEVERALNSAEHINEKALKEWAERSKAILAGYFTAGVFTIATFLTLIGSEQNYRDEMYQMYGRVVEHSANGTFQIAAVSLFVGALVGIFTKGYELHEKKRILGKKKSS